VIRSYRFGRRDAIAGDLAKLLDEALDHLRHDSVLIGARHGS
jgi:hypothetical protein